MSDLENQEREIINLMFSQGISWLTAVRMDMLQQECEALLVDFPDQEKELRELSTWIAGAVR